MTRLPSLLILVGCIAQCLAASRHVKEAAIPTDADSLTRIEIAATIVPSPEQLRWQELELTAFLHFGINTFTGREWGDGTESPALFNPTELDTDQWVETLCSAGFKMVILTAKHHDGFCLWPTATTAHSVASSPWLNGHGDVVKMLRQSCDKYGMKLGLYLSPWDRNAACYGDSPRYNDMFVAQLTELLSNYGRIDEVWFDGACGEGPDGRRQQYDWMRFRDVMKSLQPHAVLAITGDDIRWVGNEDGLGRSTEWTVTPLMPSIYPQADSINRSLNIDALSPDLGSRHLLNRADRLYWWPSEVDVSIRQGWFHHPDQEPKSLRELAQIYLSSVGRNSTLLLNIPPDSRGLIDPADSIRLQQFHRWIADSFSNNLLHTPNATVNAIVLDEEIAAGQRVEAFDVEALMPSGQWKTVASGTTIGHKRILTFEPTQALQWRLSIRSSRLQPNARIVGAYCIDLLPQ